MIKESLKIICCSRLGTEKGIDRLVDFAKMIPFDYVIDVYGEGSVKPSTVGTNVTFKGFDPKAREYIENYDYLIQLSDCEGYCYSINEALVAGVPVLLTPFPSGMEQVVDGVNGYFIPFDLKDIDFDKLLKVPKPKKYKPKADVKDWINFINLAILNTKTMKVKIINYNSTFKIGEVVDISEERAKSAVERGLAEYVIEKKETKKPKKL